MDSETTGDSQNNSRLMRLRKITGTHESVISSDVVLTTVTTLSMG